MSSPSLRAGSRSLRLRSSSSSSSSIRTNPPLGSKTNITPRAGVHSLARNAHAHSRRIAPLLNSNTSLRTRINALVTPTATVTSQLRTYCPSSTPSEATADNLIEELQDLYEIAKDEFEIATDSTDGSTIYAASDRESARDALNQLVAVYELYSGSKVKETHAGSEEADAGKGEGAAVVETNFDPATVGDEVRGEVKKRVGQRIRELKNAVEILEERAQED